MKILAVDYGDVRTGLACCDEQELLASPVGVVTQPGRTRLIREVAQKAAELGAGQIVVGHPVNMNGTLGPRSEQTREFAALLAQETGLPVALWDERSTTVSAHQILNVTDVRGKKRKNVVDAVAAVLILEGYLAWRKSQKEQE